MAGLAGATGPTDWAPGSLLKKMTESLRFTLRSTAESWADTRTGLCRVRVGVDNPEPQPIFSRDQTKCIVLFGECFGYEELKRKLIRDGQVFDVRDNDAEFVLRLYESYGEGTFSQLNGSYCFAIYDSTKGELLLVNDRLASRPLFYGTTPDGKLIFATQVSTVLGVPGISRELDVAATLEFCTLQRVLGDKTYHRGVRALMPASILRYRAGNLKVTPYWYPEYRPEPKSADEFAEELAATVKRALGHVTDGSGRVAMLLSGGLDARMVVAATESKLICYTFGDYENPEVQTAQRIAKSRGFEFRFLKREPNQYSKIVDTAVDIGNGMHPFNHAHTLGFIESIAQECDVVTHGFVPELLFRGYSLPKVSDEVLGIKRGNKLDDTLTEATLPQRLFRRGYSLLGKGVEELFAPAIRETLHETLLVSAREFVAQAEGHSNSIFDKFLWPDMYYYARYPSMLFELSLRPYMTERSLVFNNDVIDLHLKMPVQMRADNRVWLAALKRLNSDVARVVDANTGHSPYMPWAVASSLDAGRELIWRMPLLWRLNSRHKRGETQGKGAGASPHSYPRFDWMIRNDLRLRELISETLNDPEAMPPQIFDSGRVHALLEDHLANRGQHRMILFALLTFGRWHKKYISA